MKPSIDSIAANAADLLPKGVQISAGYIGNLLWAPRRDDRSWMFFKSNGAKAEGWPAYGKPTEDALAEYALTHAVEFSEWVQASMEDRS